MAGRRAKRHKLDLKAVEAFVNRNIDAFHTERLRLLQQKTLPELLKAKNPYLFRAKNLLLAQEFVEEVLVAHISSSEERAFGGFLEDLAIFVSEMTRGARKSGIQGIDLEFEDETKHYLVSVKSGPKWGNSRQQRDQARDFETAVRIIKQSKLSKAVEPVLGICYGKTRTTFVRSATKIVGQNFWYLISGSETIYKDIIEPLGYEAKKHNQAFLEARAAAINLFTKEFTEDYCVNGSIDWPKVVEFNSGNLKHPDEEDANV